MVIPAARRPPFVNHKPAAYNRDGEDGKTVKTVKTGVFLVKIYGNTKGNSRFKGHQGAAFTICAYWTDMGTPTGTWALLTIIRGLDFPDSHKAFTGLIPKWPVKHGTTPI